MMTSTAEELQAEGLRLFQEGLYDEAALRFSEALEHFAEDGREVEAGEMLNNIGVIRRKQSRWEDALEVLEEAHRIFVRVEDRSREAQALGNMASVYASLKQQEKAIESWRKAAAIFAALDDRQNQGETFIAIGLSLFKSGQRQEGLAAYQAGLDMLERPTVMQKFSRTMMALQARLFR